MASPQLAFCASAILPAAWPSLKMRWARRPLARRWRIFTPQVQRDASPERHLSGLTMQFVARFPVLDIPDDIKIGYFPSYFVVRGRSASPDWEEHRVHEVRECCVFCVFSSALPSMQVLLMSCQRIQRDFKYVQPHSPSDARFDSLLCFPVLPGDFPVQTIDLFKQSQCGLAHYRLLLSVSPPACLLSRCPHLLCKSRVLCSSFCLLRLSSVERWPSWPLGLRWSQ